MLLHRDEELFREVISSTAADLTLPVPERAKESGTEQNYNMIDGCVNNNPKKPRIIGNRISVLDRLHIKLEERKQKSQPQQQQQQERSWKN